MRGRILHLLISANLHLLQLMVVSLVLFDLLLQGVASDRVLGTESVPLPLHLLEQVDVLAAQNEFLSQLDSATVCSEALKMVGGRAGDALQDLDRVARDATATAIV